jgi:hypothetical protein
MEGGFIQGKLEIKLLLLYILCRLEAPVNMDTLTDVAMCDDGVSYFDLSAALAELTESEHVSRTDELYQVTDKGRRNSAITEDNLPYSVRLRCDHRLVEINAQMRKLKRIHGAVIPREDDRFQLRLALDGEDGENVFTMTLLCDTQEEADRLEKSFRRDPEGFVARLQSVLS